MGEGEGRIVEMKSELEGVSPNLEFKRMIVTGALVPSFNLYI